MPACPPGRYRQCWEELTYSYDLQRRVAPLSSKDAVQQRHDEQSENGGNEESADHGATQWGVLFSAIAGPKAIGIMPMIMASAVMQTGRSRV